MSAEKALGKRATTYVRLHGVARLSWSAYATVPTEYASAAVARTITRVYGAPEVNDSGNSYWLIPLKDWREITRLIKVWGQRE